MELIRISSDRIKITLTSSEVEEYELTEEGSNDEVFRELLVCARNETGFETDGRKLFVQIFKAKGGGCEIFVSRIEKEKRNAPVNGDRAYRFGTLEHMIAACKAIARLGGESFSSAYGCDEGYLLVLYSPSDAEASYALEWGEERAVPVEEYLAEHYRLIRANDAVKTLGGL